MKLATTVATASARTTPSHQGQPRLICVIEDAPKMAIMYPAIPATVICDSDTMPP